MSVDSPSVGVCWTETQKAFLLTLLFIGALAALLTFLSDKVMYDICSTSGSILVRRENTVLSVITF